MNEDDGIFGGENFDSYFREQAQNNLIESAGQVDLYESILEVLEERKAEILSFDGFGKMGNKYKLTPEQEVVCHQFVADEIQKIISLVNSQISRYNIAKEKATNKFTKSLK